MKDDFEKILDNISAEMEFKVIAYEMMPDHIHLLLDCNPKFNILSIIKRIKGTSSRILRDKYPELKSRISTLWTHSKFVTTAGDVDINAIKSYIEEQRNV